MRDGQVFLWQAAVFLLLALGFVVLGLDLTRFPGVLVLAALALGLTLLTGLAVHLRRVRVAALCGMLLAGVGGCGVVLVFAELLFVVTPASVGMEGLLLGYVVSGLFGAAANAALAAARALWQEPVRTPPVQALGGEPAAHPARTETVHSR